MAPQASGPPTDGQGWQRLDSPVAGWIQGSQLTAIDCDGSVAGSSDTGVDIIVRLAHQARSDNEPAAVSFLAMARGVDGALAEVYVDQIGDWAITEPSTLAAAFKGRPDQIRDAIFWVQCPSSRIP